MVPGMCSRVVKGALTVLDEMYDGSHHAERHRCTMTLIDGRVIDRKIHFFATLSEDGRFQRVHKADFDLG
jgi:hypothetical protein